MAEEITTVEAQRYRRLRSLPTTRRRGRRADEGYGACDSPGPADFDWASCEREIEIDGARACYAEVGDPAAPAIVKVHGIDSNWHAWRESTPRLAAEGWRVVAVDLPGFGASPMPPWTPSIPGYASFLDSLSEELGLGRAVFVGNSMGGLISAQLALDRPRRVRGLVLVNAGGISTARVPLRLVMAGGRMVARGAARYSARADRVAAKPRLSHRLLSSVARHPSRLPPGAVESLIGNCARPAFLPALRSILAHDLRPRLGEIRSPTLVVWGRNDVLIPVKDAGVFSRGIRSSQLVILEDTGHLPMIERPRAFNQALLRFLAGLEGVSTSNADEAAEAVA